MSGDVKPMASLEAEQSVLGGLLLDISAWDRAGDMLVESDFSREVHRQIWRLVGAEVAKCRPVDVITIFEAARAAGMEDVELAYLNGLAESVPSAANIRRYAEIVRECAVRRRMVGAFSELSETAARCDKPADAIEAAAAVMAGFHAGVASRPTGIAEIALRRTEWYEALAMGEVPPGWPTAIPMLDDMLAGGLRPGRMYIVAARPGVGKSSFSLWLALALARSGKAGLYLSLEMAKEELGDRAVSAIGSIDYGRLQTGKLQDDDWGRVAEACDELSRLPLSIDDQGGLDLTQIRAKARQVPGLQFLVLDYLQLCSGPGDNRNAQIEQLSRGLKALAKELGIAVIALSQLNRQVEQRQSPRPNLADLRDSGSIEQDADVVMMLWREKDDSAHQVIGLAIEKQRNGQLGSLALHFDGARQRWGQSMEPLGAHGKGKPRGNL